MHRARLLAATAAGLLLLATGACTDTPKSVRATSSPTTSGPATDVPTRVPTPEPLTQDQLEHGLLKAGHLGRAFTTELVPGAPFHTVFDDPSVNLGCLRKLDRIDFGVPFERSVAFTFDAKNDARSPSVINLLGSADDAAQVRAGLREALRALRACNRVSTSSNGVQVRADVAVDRTRSTRNVDQQLNVRTVGQMRILRSTFPIGMWVSVVRIDDQVAILSVLDLDRDNAAAQRRLTKMSAQRLAALVDGSPPPRVRLVRLETELPK